MLGSQERQSLPRCMGHDARLYSKQVTEQGLVFCFHLAFYLSCFICLFLFALFLFFISNFHLSLFIFPFYLRFLILQKSGDRGGLGQGEQLRPDPDLLLQAGLDQELVSICLIFFISICFIRKIFFVFLIFFISICLNIFLYLPDLLFLLGQGHESS